MASNERLTDIGDHTSEPVTMNDDGTTDKGPLLPKDWAYDGGSLRPLEFALAEEEPALAHRDITPEFARDLYNVLKNIGLEDLVGISSFTKHEDTVMLEHTKGRRSSLTELPASQALPEDVVAASWSFHA
ncbi:MAG: hypothetical protein Q9226_005360 [Calogaya cf. arnoldii]